MGLIEKLPFVSDYRISNMLKASGQSDLEAFKNICWQGYEVIRQNSNLILSLIVMIMPSSSLSLR